MTRYMRIAGITLFMALCAASVQAQNKQAPKNAPAQPRNPPAQPKAPPAQPKAGMFNGAQPATALVTRLARMAPEERQRALSNLPPGQRARISNQLERFMALSPQDQARLRNQAMVLSRMPPARQEEIRSSLRAFNQMDIDRKRVLSREMRALALLPTSERRAVMSSDAFVNRFSAPERKIMADLAEIMPPGPLDPNDPAAF
jgi:hypothetical protein